MANKFKNLDLIRETVLKDNEIIKHAIFGAYETSTLGTETIRKGVLAATNKRVIFYSKRLTGYDLENFDYSRISTFELSKKLMGNKITFYSSGNKVSMKWIQDNELDDFINYVHTMINGAHKNSTKPIDQQDNPEIQNLKQIKMLKELLDMGALTEEEFSKKKSELL